MRRRLTLAPALLVIGAALLYQVGCGSSSPAAPSTPSPVGGGGTNSVISIVANNGSQSFSPNPASVPVGQAVTWRNADSDTHHIVADNGSFDAGTTTPGATSAAVTVGNGPIAYHCAIHPTMVGTINGSQGTGPTGPGY